MWMYLLTFGIGVVIGAFGAAVVLSGDDPLMEDGSDGEPDFATPPPPPTTYTVTLPFMQADAAKCARRKGGAA